MQENTETIEVDCSERDKKNHISLNKSNVL